MSLKQLSEAAGLLYQGADMAVPPISIDTRTLQHGDLFVALVGPNFDSHHFIDAALAKGASAVLVQEAVQVAVPQIIASDTTTALGQLARRWRQQFTLPVIGLTGNCGKTTVKAMVASIMHQACLALVTQGNKNNVSGLPMTLLGLRDEHHCAVIEMGTNAVGEIPYLAGIARPTVALITNVRASHLAGLGSLQGVADEKGAIYDYLAASGSAVINADEPFMDQ